MVYFSVYLNRHVFVMGRRKWGGDRGSGNRLAIIANWKGIAYVSPFTTYSLRCRAASEYSSDRFMAHWHVRMVVNIETRAIRGGVWEGMMDS